MVLMVGTIKDLLVGYMIMNIGETHHSKMRAKKMDHYMSIKKGGNKY